MSEEAVLHRGSNPRGDAIFSGAQTPVASDKVRDVKRL